MSLGVDFTCLEKWAPGGWVSDCVQRHGLMSSAGVGENVGLCLETLVDSAITEESGLARNIIR